MRVKITGVYDLEVINHFIEAGADGFTFNFSDRDLNHEKLRDLIIKIPPMIFKAGLFSTEDPPYLIEELVTFCQLDLLEFNGNTFKEQYRYSLPIIKHVENFTDLEYQGSQTKVALVQLPRRLLKKRNIDFQPLILDVEQEEDLELLLKIKPYGVNLNYTGSPLKLISWIKWIKVAF